MSSPRTAPVAANPARRRFFKHGGALAVAFTLAPDLLAQSASIPSTPPPLPGSLNNNRRLDAWLRIDPAGKVTVFTGKVELGQGILTALTQIVADELDVSMPRIVMISGDTTQTPDEGVTSGSLSIEYSGIALRYACAEVRALLLAAAAARIGVPVASLVISDGTISAGQAAGQSITYWTLSGEVSLAREAGAQVAPKPATQHRIMGQSVPRRDIPGKVTGGVAYVQDMRLPGMLFGRVVRPPAPRAKLLSLDLAAIRALPGVVAVVRDGNFLAVAAEREEQAIDAREAMMTAARWELPNDLPPAGSALYAHLKSAKSQENVVSSKTSVIADSGVKTLNAEYTRPFQAHASIGPSCAVAQWNGSQMKVWTHSQGVFPLRTDLVKALKLPARDILVMHREGSGCYGHNGADDVALDAALLARAVKDRPVKLQWMRDDEFTWEPYGSAMVVQMRASLDAAGRIVDWQHELWSYTHSTRPGDREGSNLLASWHLETPLTPSPARNIPQPSGGSDRNSVPLYVFPQQKVINHMLPVMPVRVSALRTLGAYSNVFAVESFMDELALAAGVDPVEFRLRHLADPRAKAVIERVAADAKWKPAATVSSSNGVSHGRGIAFAKYKNLAVYVAVIADIEVDRASGEIRVSHISVAADAGLIINPNGMTNQLEGGAIQSTSWTLREAIDFDHSRILTRSWADYPALRFADVPAVSVSLINRPNEKSLGVGEGTHGPTVAAIANAFAAATGKRLRDIPFTPAKVKTLLGA